MIEPKKVFLFWLKGGFKVRVKVILVCEECLSRNYTTTKNPQKNVERIETNKYCKNCNKYTVHKETR